MRSFLFIFLLQFLIAFPASDVKAGVAEASTGIDSTQTSTYDLSDLSSEEIEWFTTFINGTFFADGWQEITDDILVKFKDEEQERQRAVLNKLGFKIGREWSRDNDTRKISTSMLRKWGKILKSTARDEPHLLAEVLRNIDGEVNSLLR